MILDFINKKIKFTTQIWIFIYHKNTIVNDDTSH